MTKSLAVVLTSVCFGCLVYGAGPAATGPASAPATQAAGGFAGKVTSVKLIARPGVLEDAALTMSASDERLFNGHFFSKYKATMAGEVSDEKTIGGVEVEFVHNGKTIQMKSKMKTVTLERVGTVGGGFRTVPFPLPDNSHYAVAFPVGFMAEQSAWVVYRSGAVQMFTLPGLTLSLYDDNLDGKFTLTGEDGFHISPPLSKVTVFGPLMRHISTPKGIYDLQELSDNGAALTYAKNTDAAGKLTVTLPVQYLAAQLAVASDDGEDSLVATVTGVSKDSFPVLPGQYSLRCGVLYHPDTGKVVAHIAPGESRTVVVTGTEAETLELGAPYTLVAKPIGTGVGRIGFLPFQAAGKMGEVYSGFACDPSHPPEVFLNYQGTVKLVGKIPVTATGAVAGASISLPETNLEGATLVVAVTAEGFGFMRAEMPFPSEHVSRRGTRAGK